MGRAPLVPLAVAFVIGIASETCGAGLQVLCAGIAGAAFVRLRSIAPSVRANAVLALGLGVLDALLFAQVTPAQPDLHVRRLAANVLDVRAASDGLVNTTIRFADGSGASVELPAPAEQVGARIVIRCRREPFDGPRNPGEPSPRDLAAERGLAWRRKRPLRAVLTANRLSCLASARLAPEVWPLRR